MDRYTFSNEHYDLVDDQIIRKTISVPGKSLFQEESELLQQLADYMENKLVADYGFVRIPLSDESITTTVLASPDWITSQKLLLILQNSSGSLLGIFSRSACFDHGLSKGSWLPYIEKGIAEGYGIILLRPNTNFIYSEETPKKTPIPGSESPENHVFTVWRDIISQNEVENLQIYLLSYGNGASLCKELYLFETKVQKGRNAKYFRIKGIICIEASQLIQKNDSIEVKNNLEDLIINLECSNMPIGTILEQRKEQVGVTCISVGLPKGTKEVKNTAISVFLSLELVFKYFIIANLGGQQITQKFLFLLQESYLYDPFNSYGKLGIPFHSFYDWYEYHKENLDSSLQNKNIAEVFEKLMKPMTKKLHCSLAALIYLQPNLLSPPNKTNNNLVPPPPTTTTSSSNNNHHHSSPNVFISYSPYESFICFMEGLNDYFHQQSSRISQFSKEIFIFMDILCINPYHSMFVSSSSSPSSPSNSSVMAPSLVMESKEWYLHNLPKIMNKIDFVLFSFANNNPLNPYALQSLKCLWELYQTIKVQCRFDIFLSSEAKETLLTKLLENPMLTLQTLLKSIHSFESFTNSNTAFHSNPMKRPSISPAAAAASFLPLASPPAPISSPSLRNSKRISGGTDISFSLSTTTNPFQDSRKSFALSISSLNHLTTSMTNNSTSSNHILSQLHKENEIISQAIKLKLGVLRSDSLQFNENIVLAAFHDDEESFLKLDILIRQRIIEWLTTFVQDYLQELEDSMESTQLEEQDQNHKNSNNDGSEDICSTSSSFQLQKRINSGYLALLLLVEAKDDDYERAEELFQICLQQERDLVVTKSLLLAKQKKKNKQPPDAVEVEDGEGVVDNDALSSHQTVISKEFLLIMKRFIIFYLKHSKFDEAKVAFYSFISKLQRYATMIIPKYSKINEIKQMNSLENIIDNTKEMENLLNSEEFQFILENEKEIIEIFQYFVSLDDPSSTENEDNNQANNANNPNTTDILLPKPTTKVISEEAFSQFLLEYYEKGIHEFGEFHIYTLKTFELILYGLSYCSVELITKQTNTNLSKLIENLSKCSLFYSKEQIQSLKSSQLLLSYQLFQLSQDFMSVINRNSDHYYHKRKEIKRKYSIIFNEIRKLYAISSGKYGKLHIFSLELLEFWNFSFLKLKEMNLFSLNDKQITILSNILQETIQLLPEQGEREGEEGCLEKNLLLLRKKLLKQQAHFERIFQSQQNYQQIITIYEELLALSQPQPQPSHLNLNNNENNNNQPDGEQQPQQPQQSFFFSFPNEEMLEIYQELGYGYYLQGNFHLAEYYFKQILKDLSFLSQFPCFILSLLPIHIHVSDDLLMMIPLNKIIDPLLVLLALAEISQQKHLNEMKVFQQQQQLGQQQGQGHGSSNIIPQSRKSFILANSTTALAAAAAVPSTESPSPPPPPPPIGSPLGLRFSSIAPATASNVCEEEFYFLQKAFQMSKKRLFQQYFSPSTSLSVPLAPPPPSTVNAGPSMSEKSTMPSRPYDFPVSNPNKSKYNKTRTSSSSTIRSVLSIITPFDFNDNKKKTDNDEDDDIIQHSFPLPFTILLFFDLLLKMIIYHIKQGKYEEAELLCQGMKTNILEYRSFCNQFQLINQQHYSLSQLQQQKRIENIVLYQLEMSLLKIYEYSNQSEKAEQLLEDYYKSFKTDKDLMIPTRLVTINNQKTPILMSLSSTTIKLSSKSIATTISSTSTASSLLTRRSSSSRSSFSVTKFSPKRIRMRKPRKKNVTFATKTEDIEYTYEMKRENDLLMESKNLEDLVRMTAVNSSKIRQSLRITEEERKEQQQQQQQEQSPRGNEAEKEGDEDDDDDEEDDDFFDEEQELGIEDYVEGPEEEEEEEEEPINLSILSNLVTVNWKQKKYDRAEFYLLKEKSLRRSIYGDEHPSTLATIHRLGKLSNLQGKFFQAERLFLDCWTIRRQVLGEFAIETLQVMEDLMELYQQQRKFTRIEKVLRFYLQVQQDVYELQVQEQLEQQQRQLQQQQEQQQQYEQEQQLEQQEHRGEMEEEEEELQEQQQQVPNEEISAGVLKLFPPEELDPLSMEESSSSAANSPIPEGFSLEPRLTMSAASFNKNKKNKNKNKNKIKNKQNNIKPSYGVMKKQKLDSLPGQSSSSSSSSMMTSFPSSTSFPFSSNSSLIKQSDIVKTTLRLATCFIQDLRLKEAKEILQQCIDSIALNPSAALLLSSEEEQQQQRKLIEDVTALLNSLCI